MHCYVYHGGCTFKSLSVAKFGGSLLDVEGNGLPKIIKQIKEIRQKDSFGPIVVFSAPMGVTDMLIKIGESYSQSVPVQIGKVFEVYEHLTETHVAVEWKKQATAELTKFHARALARSALTPSHDRYEWRWTLSVFPLEAALGPIALSAVALLTQGDLTRVKQCGGVACGWLFYDETKNNRRRWCEMEVCGNRAKQRRRAARGREA